MDSLESLHRLHAVVITATAIGCCVAFYERLRLPRNHYLIDWLLACLVWVVYYLMRFYGLASGLNGQTVIADPGAVVVEFGINGTNTALVLSTALSVSIKESNLKSKLRNLVLLPGFLLATMGVLGFLAWALDLRFVSWVRANSYALALLSGLVLILLYQRVSQLPHVSMKLGTSFLWVFGLYALLQTWYPDVVVGGQEPTNQETFVYLSVMLLKVAGTILLFLAAAKPRRPRLRP